MQTTPMNFKNGVTIAVLLLIIFFSVGKISKQVQTFVGSGNKLAQTSNLQKGGESIKPVTYIQGASSTFVQPGDSVAFPASVTNGNKIIVGLMWSYSACAPTLSDTRGNTYTQVGTVSKNTATSSYDYWFVAPVTSSGANTLTLNASCGSARSMFITEYAGLSANPFVSNNTQTNSSSPCYAGSITTTTKGSLVLGMFGDSASRTFTSGSGFTERLKNQVSMLEEQVKSSTGAINPSSTCSANTKYEVSGHSAVFSPAVISTPTNPTTPTVTLASSPTSITSGSSSTLTWSSTNATSCTASGAWSGTQATSGTSNVSPTATSTYTLNCTGTGGSVSKSATVAVTTTTAATVNLSASPMSISAGQSSTLNWSSANVSSCVASKGWTGAQANSGTLIVTPASTTTYTLTCTDTTGNAIAKSVTIGIIPTAGPVTLPTPPLIFQVPMPTQTGKVWTIAAGDHNGFQAALNQAQLGDTIELQAGSTYTGNFTFPKKNSGSGWIVVRSSKHASLPALGVRVAPSDASNMAQLVSPNVQSTVIFAPGSHHYRLIGLEVTEAISTKYIQTAIVAIYPASGNVADLPNNITLDRMYIHSQPTTGVQRCVHADGSYVAIIDSYLGECHAKGFDSQAIAAWNTNGPIKIVNNMLEGAGENVMFGGADPLIQGANPSDIEVRGNYIYTPVAWKGTLNGGTGTSLWTKKNLFELKTGKRILVEGNVLDGSWGDAQVGHAFVIKSANQGGKCTWCQTTDLTVRYNIIRNVGGTGGVSATSGQNNGHVLGGPTSRVLFEHNYFENINVGPYTGVARLIELYNNPPDVTYRNNTWNNSSGGTIQHYISAGSAPTATNFTYMDNIAPFGTYGVVPGYTEAGLAAAVRGTFNYSGNVVYGKATGYSSVKYPKTQLAPDYATALTVGKGANMSLVQSATAKSILGK